MEIKPSPPVVHEGLLAIPANLAALAGTVHDLYALGIRPASILAVGRQADTPLAEAEAALGLLGGLVTLGVPEAGPLILAGGAGAITLEAPGASAYGTSLGSLIAAFADLTDAAQHQALYASELALGRWLLIVTGTPLELRRAAIALDTHPMLHRQRV
jgi:hypothetical protein